MVNLPFHISHICDSITDPLSFTDLLNCILVNRHWHDTFIPILWSDVVTFRTDPGPHRKQTSYHDYSLHYYGHQGISKHAHHIRALTCQGVSSLQTLVDSLSCVNLVEINFVIDRLGSPGLDDLVDLMSVNPSLRAVSIENVDLRDKATESQLYELLDFLDHTPSITNVCLVAKESQLQEKWDVVWGRMYSRIDRNTIHSLRIRSDYPSRSKRALTDGRPWPVRETPFSAKVEHATVRRELPSGARWENEARSRDPSYGFPYRYRPYDSLAVLENRGSLDLCASDLYMFKLMSELLQRPPPSWDTIRETFQLPQEFVESMGTTLRQLFPNMRKLDISNEYLSHIPVEYGLSFPTGLSSLSLSFRIDHMPLLPLLLSTHSEALSSLTLYGYNAIPMTDFFSIVTCCPNLLDLRVSALQDVEGPEVSPPWICKDLRKLDITLRYRDTCTYDMYPHNWSFEQEIASARRLAPSLLQQLDGLTHLHDLCLGLNSEYYEGESPFFELSVDPVYGLPQLAGLQQLKTFKVTGLLHSVDQEEIEWMRTHWPLLYSLDVPILVEANGHRKRVPRSEVGVLTRAYEQWYPGLKILIPESSYGCSECQDLYCGYGDQGTGYDYDPIKPVDAGDEDDWVEYEHEETTWALDDEYHLSKHYVHKSEWWPKYSRRQMQCGHGIQRYLKKKN
ncbi:hypothetical protein BGZ82_008522 [Podila clonocystis]|nr:hypothetical protein BGZ82_008522 [Podila clonocystis]